MRWFEVMLAATGFASSTELKSAMAKAELVLAFNPTFWNASM